MSELKTYKMVDEKYCADCVCVIPSEVYLKSEADKQLRHQKYKRCLAMAKWCRIHDEFTQLESERSGLSQRALFIECRKKAMWWNKWHKRWLELAEKFKEAR